jgi:hypothetical protein
VNALPAACVLAADLIVVVAASWLLVRWLARGLAGVFEPLLAWAWCAGALLAGAGVALGSLGALGEPGFLAAHCAVLAALAAARRRHLPGDIGALRELRGRIAGLRALGAPEVASALALLGLLVALAAIAALARPVVYDALTYRLPRIAQWLQDGRVGHYATSDPRQNYMPVVPDLVMAWLITGTRDGFQPAALAQCYGGALLMAATYGLSRCTGLSRMASMGSVALLFGMANVVPQFTTEHTDLFAAGELGAAFCLWVRAAERGEGSVLAGIGAGMALGSKGTLFYLAPGAAIWVAWAARRYRPGPRAWAATVAPALLSAAFFAAPVFARNWRDYGGPFGPADFVRMHHGAASAGQLWAKLTLNLGASFSQLFDPNSQPPGLRAGSRAVGEAVARALPERDPFSFGGLDRRQTLLDILARPEPDADATSFGILAFLGLAAGAATAAASLRRPGAGAVLAWSAGIAAFWVFFHAMQLWHPYGFRYFVLVAPWMAVVSSWWMQTLPRPVRGFAWALSLAASLAVGWAVLTTTHQAGWRAVAQPGRSRGYHVYVGWREWAGGLGPADAPLRLALEFNQPAAAFYRLFPPRKVLPEAAPGPGSRTAEELVRGRGGWLVVPAALFMGREGMVAGRTWLFEGDPASPFSVAAYRSLGPGEVPAPLVYRRETSAGARRARSELLVRTWAGATLRLVVRNAGARACRYSVFSPVAAVGGDLAPDSSREVALAVPAGAVAEISAVFESGSPEGPAPAGVSVELAP